MALKKSNKAAPHKKPPLKKAAKVAVSKKAAPKKVVKKATKPTPKKAVSKAVKKPIAQKIVKKVVAKKPIAKKSVAPKRAPASKQPLKAITKKVIAAPQKKFPPKKVVVTKSVVEPKKKVVVVAASKAKHAQPQKHFNKKPIAVPAKASAQPKQPHAEGVRKVVDWDALWKDRMKVEKRDLGRYPLKEKSQIYIGTAIDSLSSFDFSTCVTLIQADVLSRFNALLGRKSYFPALINTGGLFLEHAMARGQARTVGEQRLLEGAVEEFRMQEDGIRHEIDEVLLRSGVTPHALWKDTDPAFMDRVYQLFHALTKKGALTYGERIVYWCPASQSILNYSEILYEDVPVKVYHIRYFVKAADKSVVLTTTRPEFILGDVAVAVHPNDKRYKEYVGKVLILPILNKEIPIIADSRVKMEEGSGAMKLTPGHNQEELEIARDHALPLYPVISPDGTMGKESGPFEGLTLEQARINVVEYLDNIGNLEKVEDRVMALPRSVYTGKEVEPMLVKGWFLDLASGYQHVLDAVASEKISIRPEQYQQFFEYTKPYMTEWCISRPMQGGIPVPALYEEGRSPLVCESQEELLLQAKKKKQAVLDVNKLDPWFVASIYPYCLDKSNTHSYTCVADLDGWYGWVARSLAIGSILHDSPLIKNVILHGIVRDELGRKSNKLRGEYLQDVRAVLDKCGGDMLRLYIASELDLTHDVKFVPDKVAHLESFMNKFWNIGRYIQSQGLSKRSYEDCAALIKKDKNKLTLSQKWLLKRLDEVALRLVHAVEKNDIGPAVRGLILFLTHEVSEWYVEIAKSEQAPLQKEVLTYTFHTLTRLFYPFIPTMAEVMAKDLLMIPKSLYLQPLVRLEHTEVMKPEDEELFRLVKGVVGTVKDIRKAWDIKPHEKGVAFIIGGSPLLSQCDSIIKSLARLETVHYDRKKLPKSGYASRSVDGAEVSLVLTPHISLNDLVDRLKGEATSLTKESEYLGKKITNEKFLSSGLTHILEEEVTKKQVIDDKLKHIYRLLNEVVHDK